PKDEWYTVENTHEPIISRELWEQAHAHIDSRKRPRKNGETQIFAGLVKCADCGKALRLMNNKSGAMKTVDKHYLCSTYSTYGKEKCSMHYIQYKVLYGDPNFS
ncbi:MAG: recombinase family protein, partial [Ruminococcus sp.]|nr:recombinase family protein [Ruminococcus sp.]